MVNKNWNPFNYGFMVAWRILAGVRYWLRIIFSFPDTKVFDRISDERINNKDLKSWFFQEAEEREVVDSGEIQKYTRFHGVQLFCFFYCRNGKCKEIRTIVNNFKSQILYGDYETVSSLAIYSFYAQAM